MFKKQLNNQARIGGCVRRLMAG